MLRRENLRISHLISSNALLWFEKESPSMSFKPNRGLTRSRLYIFDKIAAINKDNIHFDLSNTQHNILTQY